MATCFGGVGDTPVEDPRTQETDNTSEGESQGWGSYQASAYQDSKY